MFSNNIELFMYTVNEYRRFYDKLPKAKMMDSYDESSYIQVNTKLMLLRKYGCNKENVYMNTIISEIIDLYPDDKEILEELKEDFENVEKQQIEYSLSDGTKFNLYQTIEDVMYGIYLHADSNRIQRLATNNEDLRFVCVRKYVEDLENVVFKTYEFLKSHHFVEKQFNSIKRAATIYLGDTGANKQAIKKSPYWSNLYGKDGDNDDLKEISKNWTKDDLVILHSTNIFLDGLRNNDVSLLNDLILPSTKRDWNNFSEARKVFNSIKKVGISSKVRYNENQTEADVRVFQKVDDIFIINTPHIINDMYEIHFIKIGKHNWKIHSVKGKMN